MMHGYPNLYVVGLLTYRSLIGGRLGGWGGEVTTHQHIILAELQLWQLSGIDAGFVC